jgi:hypothetical protein
MYCQMHSLRSWYVMIYTSFSRSCLRNIEYVVHTLNGATETTESLLD